MLNNLRYTVRSREIVDLISALKNDALILSPYFQRNLVWREGHKKDFIDTVLNGYPFPQIFLARGPIDIETMKASTCVVDGQQRLNSIREFVNDKFDVKGKKFSQLTIEEKTEFLKYEVAVIDFDLNADDNRLKDIFHRLNRTYYALSGIEKIASEFSSSQFLITARVLCERFDNEDNADDIELTDLFDDTDNVLESEQGQIDNQFHIDPALGPEIQKWIKERSDGAFCQLVSKGEVFSTYESSRKVPLMFVLNVMSTYHAGYYNRNAQVKTMLEQFNNQYDAADDLIEKLNATADHIRLVIPPSASMWWNKANLFTLIVQIMNKSGDLKAVELARENLANFAKDVPKDYQLAAREAVNNKAERLLRAGYVAELI